MKRIRKILIIAAFSCMAVNMMGQQPAITNTSTGAAASDKPVWSIGISGSVVDDDGDSFGNLFNMESWHFLPYPTRFHVDMAINPSISFEAAFTYNILEAGKIQNGVELAEDGTFIAFDVNARYHFIKKQGVFDPYGTGGLGFTYRSTLQSQTPTLNAGLGANIWFIPSFGLNLQSTVKLKMIAASSSYMLHSLGLVYRLGK